MKLPDIAPGWKTALAVVGIVLTAFFGDSLDPKTRETVLWCLSALGAWGIGSKIERARSVLPILLCALVLSGCAGLTPSSGSAGSAGAPMPATNVAQTVRDQAAVPSQAYGGHINWYFASQGSPAVQSEILAMAREQKWSAEQLTAALASTNGAPQSVTITSENVQGGNADAAGSGTGGSGTLQGGGTLNRP